MAKEAKAPGRPSTYTDDIAAEICERLTKGEPLAAICRDDHMPAYRTVYDWQKANETFSANIACAREAGFDAIAVECLNIADDTSSDDKWGGESGDVRTANSEWISRSKLRVETRLKLLAKWDPKRYGDKVALTGGDDGDKPLTVVIRKPE
ncbi:hypothetical protein [Phenylobacterium sp.]|uniref:terminase small subunit-like protein n=1 Tax=Phenylobacterium sp. TaxID=1871053 RepID=UPI0026159254|nr:hypothetical protein [Phenylobacterium sp.]